MATVDWFNATVVPLPASKIPPPTWAVLLLTVLLLLVRFLAA